MPSNVALMLLFYLTDCYQMQTYYGNAFMDAKMDCEYSFQKIKIILVAFRLGITC